MIPTPVQYVDGYAGAQPLLSVVPEPRFPFRNNPASPDVFTREFLWDYLVPGKYYIPPVARRTAWTNALLYSETLEHATWTKTNVTPTDNVRTAPDGETTMGKLLETTTTGEHSITQAVTATAVPWEFSVFIRGGLTRTFIRMSYLDSAAATHNAFFEFGAGRIGTKSTGVTAKIIPLGDDYFRCVLQVTPAAGAGTFKVNLATSGTVISYAGTITAGAYVWGMQANAGVESPYISTTTAARLVSAPDRDPNDPFAYLINETEPTPLGSAQASVRRTYSRIPRQQVVPDSQWIKKPDLQGVFPQVSGDALIVQPEPTVPRWIFYSNIAVITDSGPPGSGAYPTGGTWTITVGGSTTGALAHNASASTIQTALNGLASVSPRGTFAVTGSYNSNFLVTFSGYVTPSATTAGLTGSGGYSAAIVQAIALNVDEFSFRFDANSGLFNGGTFTLTIFGQTTAAIAYNATAAAVKTAIEALSNVGTSVVAVTLPSPGWTSTILSDIGDKIGFFVNIDLLPVSVTGSSLTPTGSAATINTLIVPTLAYWQNSILLTGAVLATRVLATASAHGITASDGIIVKQGTSYFTIAPGNYSASGNSITLTLASGAPFTNTGTILTVGKATGNVYTAEAKLTRVKRITDFYLIGVSPGVDDIDDIPLPTYEGDAASFLSAIFSGDTEINYEVGELDPYKDGPILGRTRTVINPQTM